MFWSFSAGTWFMTQVRVSWIFPIFFLLLWFRWENGTLAAMFSGILFLSVLAHEFGHVVASRMTGGMAHEIVVWPLTGMSLAQPDQTTRSQFITLLGGPMVNVMLCLISAYAATQASLAANVWNPLAFPISEFPGVTFNSVMVLLFWTNWVHLLLNMIPIFPFDAGGVAKLYLSQQVGREAARQLVVSVGIFTGLFALAVGWAGDHSSIVLLGAVVAIFNLQQIPRYAESQFDGENQSPWGVEYDSEYATDDWKLGNESAQQSWWQRWKQRRAELNAEKERQQVEIIQDQLDTLLQKVHEHGMSSLSVAERQLLQKASDHLKQREESGSNNT